MNVQPMKCSGIVGSVVVRVLPKSSISSLHFTPKLLIRAKNFTVDQFRTLIQGCSGDDLFKTDANGLTIVDYVLSSLCKIEQLEKLRILFSTFDQSYAALYRFAIMTGVQMIGGIPPKKGHDLQLVNAKHLVFAIRELSYTHIELLTKHAIDYGFSFDSPKAMPILNALFFSSRDDVKCFFQSIGVQIDDPVKTNWFRRSESWVSGLSIASTIESMI